MNDFLQYDFLGMEVWRILALVVTLFMGFFLGKIGSLALLKTSVALEESKQHLGSIVCCALGRSITFVAIALGIRTGILFLNLPDDFIRLFNTAASVLIVVAIGWTFFNLVDVPYTLYKRWAQKKQSKLTDMISPMLRSSLRIAVVILTIVQVAQVLSDKPITSVIAGLGIGGLAIALAAQDSLKHLFGSIVIFADRPFEVGDRLQIDGVDGPVVEVGFRSTKIRTLDGHLVTIPNGELVNKNILNVTKRPYIRRTLNVTITYDTPPHKVEEAVAIIKDLLKDHEGMDPEFPPRVLFNDFNSTSLNILVIYWYHPPDFWKYMAFTERFNLELLKRFGEAGIDFAFPTQTLHLAGDPKRPLEVGLKGDR